MDPTTFMTELVAIWTERDRARRRSAFEAHYHSDVRFHDHDGSFTGLAELETFSDGLQQRFPGAVFALSQPAERLGDGIRAFWTFGRVTGMDFAVLDGDKVRTLYAFVTLPAR